MYILVQTCFYNQEICFIPNELMLSSVLCCDFVTKINTDLTEKQVQNKTQVTS